MSLPAHLFNTVSMNEIMNTHIRMKTKQLLLAAVILATVSSCVISNYDSGYRWLSPAEKAKIRICNKAIDSLTNDGNVYLVNASQVEKYLSDKRYVVLYECRPYCRSEECITGKVAEEECHEHGLGFCLVATSFPGIFSKTAGMKAPVLMTDTNGQKSDKHDNYINRFFVPLIGEIYNSKDFYQCFHLFYNGKYVKTYPTIKEAVADGKRYQTPFAHPS